MKEENFYFDYTGGGTYNGPGNNVPETVYNFFERVIINDDYKIKTHFDGAKFVIGRQFKYFDNRVVVNRLVAACGDDDYVYYLRGQIKESVLPATGKTYKTWDRNI